MPAKPTSRIVIQEIPASTPPGELATIVNRRFRDLEQSLKGLVAKDSPEDVNVSDGKELHRVVGLADPRNDTDAVNLRTLRRGIGGRRNEQADTTSTGETQEQHYAVIFTKDGFVGDEEESPWLTIDEHREGYPVSALITAKLAPSSETLKVNFKVLRVGDIDTLDLLELPLEIVVDENGPTFSDLGLRLHEKFPKGTRVCMFIEKAGDAEQVVGQIVMRRAL